MVATFNDRGRVAVADSIGPSAQRVEGTVRARSDSTLLLAIASVSYLNGERTKWAGEAVTLRLNSLGSLQERRFSRSRTGLVVGAAVALVGSFIATRTLGKDRGDDINDPGMRNPPVDQQRGGPEAWRASDLHPRPQLSREWQ